MIVAVLHLLSVNISCFLIVYKLTFSLGIKISFCLIFENLQYQFHFEYLKIPVLTAVNYLVHKEQAIYVRDKTTGFSSTKKKDKKA